MGVQVQWPASSALLRRLDAINAAVKPNSRAANRVKGDIRKIVIEDNTEKLLGRGNLEGVDRYGKPLAKMADSTFRNPRRGFGPVLVPRGLSSRFITNFVAVWEGGVLVMRYVGIVNKQGRSFVQYHLTGCPKGSNAKRPNWSLPKRDVAGITPAGFAKIRARHTRFAEDVLRGNG
jgi:hypothetical protein